MALAQPVGQSVGQAVAQPITGPQGSSGGGGGGGAASSEPVVYQQTAYPGASFNNVSGAQTFNLPNVFQGGRDVIVALEWFQGSSAGIASVTVNGVAAVRWGQGAGTTARTEVWAAANVPAAGNKQVTITPNAGTGFYINAGAAEISRLSSTTVADVIGSTSNTSGVPSATTAATNQAAEAIVSMWRDNAGLSTANTVTAPLAGLFSQADGNLNLGGGGGFRLTNRQEAQSGAFTCTPATTWFADTFALKFALPVTWVGQTIQLWGGSDAWSPLTLSYASASATGALVVCAAWWNSNRTIGNPFPLPTDSAGAFTSAVNPLGTASGTPLGILIAHEFNPSVATHTITPSPLNTDDDGCFAALYIPAVTALRCTGTTRRYHAPVTPPDAGTYQNCSVTTAGSAPQVGDIFVAVFGMDPNSVTNADINWQPPAGAVVLAQRYDVRDIVGYLTVVGVITVAGHLTLNPTWTDANTFWAEGGIAVYH